MKTYYLRRHEDVSGNSGCGRVAQVAEFDDGAAVLHWNRGANSSGVSSTEVFASVSDLLRVHGHDGRSVLERIEEQDMAQGNAGATIKVAQPVGLIALASAGLGRPFLAEGEGYTASEAPEKSRREP